MLGRIQSACKVFAVFSIECPQATCRHVHQLGRHPENTIIPLLETSLGIPSFPFSPILSLSLPLSLRPLSLSLSEIKTLVSRPHKCLLRFSYLFDVIVLDFTPCSMDSPIETARNIGKNEAVVDVHLPLFQVYCGK